MSYFFNADEIFEMAEQIERNGAKFYRRAAEQIETPDSRKLLLELADMEDEHEKTFIKMRAEMLKQGQIATVDPAFDPDGEVGLYLQAMADGHIFDTRKDLAESLTGQETTEDILIMAIGREKDSVVFYTGMKDMVSEKLGKDKINGIIREEMGHVTSLSNELAKLSQ
jgi:rubrerythrin